MLNREQIMALFDQASLGKNMALNSLLALMPELKVPTDEKDGQEYVERETNQRLAALCVVTSVVCAEGSLCVEHHRQHTGVVLDIVRHAMLHVIDMCQQITLAIDAEQDRADRESQVEKLIEDILARRSRGPTLNG